MKKLLLVLFVVFVPAAAFAQSGPVQFTKQFCDAAGVVCSAAFPAAPAGTPVTVRLTAVVPSRPGPGQAAVQDVVVTDALPPQLRFVSMTITPQSGFTCTTPAVGQSGTVQCQSVFLGSNFNITFDIRVQVAAGTAPGTYPNTATFSGNFVTVFDEVVPFTTSSSASVTVIAAAPALPGANVPTLSEWMLLVMALALGTTAALVMRR